MRIKSIIILAIVCLTANAQHILEPVSLVGCMNYSEAWSDDSSVDTQIGMYSFLSDGSNAFTAVSSTGKADIANAGGAYGNGRYICYNLAGSYVKYYLTMQVWSTSSTALGGSPLWKQVKSVSLPASYKYVPRDLTYDYRTDRFYAVCQETYENSSTGYLCTVDTITGEMTSLGHLSMGIANVAADASGQLYGIGNDGHMYQIALDGTLTDLGQTDYRPTAENQGATIDLRTGKYFWAANAYKVSSGSLDDVYTQQLALSPIGESAGSKSFKGSSGSSGFRVDTLFSFPRREQLSGLCIVSTHPDAPDVLDDLKFTPKQNGGMEATVTFTAPTTTYAQGTLSGKMQATLSIDGITMDTRTLTPGEQYSYNAIVFLDGNHTATVALAKDGLNGIENTVTTFFGKDTPQAPDSVSLVRSEDLESVTLKWPACKTGVNGGWIDPENVTYTVTRLPENTVVASGIKETTFTDNVDRIMRHTRYSVTCTSGTLQSKATRSAWTNVGMPNTIPFKCSFDSQDEFDEFFVIDNNHDGTDGFESSMWQWDDDYYAAFYYGYYDVTADDYLITPSLKLNPARLYRMSFRTYGYQGMDNRLLIQVGSRPTVEKLSRTICDWTSQSTMSTPIRKTIFFNIKEGDRYIAFHNVSDPYDHMSIDDVLIEDFSSAEVPDTVQDLQVSEVSGHRAKLTMKLPTITAMDTKVEAPLTLYIYKESSTEPAFYATDLTPGQSYEWTDESSTTTLSTYRVSVENEFGVGLEVKRSIDLSITPPDAPTDVKVGYINEGKDVRVSWSSGRYDDEEYRYFNVYRGDSLIATGLSGGQYIDHDPSENGTVALQTATYSVSAANAGGESDKVKTTTIMIGTPYSLPFNETWEYQQAKTAPWLQGSTSYCCWSAVSTAYNPFALGQDGPGLMNCDVDGESAQAGWATIQTPSIDFSNASNSHLSFYLYRDPQYNSYTYLEVYKIIEGGDTTMVGSRIYCHSTLKGWEKQEMDISVLDDAPRASLIFFGGVVGSTNSIHLDNVSVTGVITGIEEVEGMKNEELRMKNCFDLGGRRVNSTNKGIYIIDNKKILKY